MGKRGRFLAGLVFAVLQTPRVLTAQEAVDTALVLAVDASGSIDPAEFDLQREGIAAAVTSPDLLDLIRFGQHATIALSYLEWGGPGTAEIVVPWAIVRDAESAGAFAAAVLAAPRSLQSYNAIGDAIVAGQLYLEACPCVPERQVIDVSGDNPDNRSIVPAPVARDRAVAAGIVINALAILQDGFLGPGGKPWLVEAYEAEVIGGPGAFVMTAQSRRDFERALLDKMLLEIAGGEPRLPQPFGLARYLTATPPGRPYQDTSVGGRAGVRAGTAFTSPRSALNGEEIAAGELPARLQ